MSGVSLSLAAALALLSGCSHAPAAPEDAPFRVAFRAGYELLGRSESDAGSIHVVVAERRGPAGDTLTVKALRTKSSGEAADLLAEMQRRLRTFRRTQTDPYFEKSPRDAPSIGFESRPLPGGKGPRFFYLQRNEAPGKNSVFAVTLLQCEASVVRLEKRINGRAWESADQSEMESLDCP